MRSKTPNSFSSLRAHHAASSQNATAQSSNETSFGDIREEARSSSRLSLRRRGTLPHRCLQIYEEMSETTNFCRLLPPFLRSSRPDVPFSSHTRRGFPPPEGSPCRKLHKFFSKVPCFWRKLHDFSPKVHSFARPVPRCRRLLAHRRPPLAAHSASTPRQATASIEQFCRYAKKSFRRTRGGEMGCIEICTTSRRMCQHRNPSSENQEEAHKPRQRYKPRRGKSTPNCSKREKIVRFYLLHATNSPKTSIFAAR